MGIYVAEDSLVAEEVGPEVESMIPIRTFGGGGRGELELDAEILMAHILDLDGDVSPCPPEGEGSGVPEMVK